MFRITKAHGREPVKEATPATAAAGTVPSLRPETDTCDQCGHAAWVRVIISAPGKRVLDFCGHHFHALEIPLRICGYKIQDKRPELIRMESETRE
jgi:hypothetical protein